MSTPLPPPACLFATFRFVRGGPRAVKGPHTEEWPAYACMHHHKVQSTSLQPRLLQQLPQLLLLPLLLQTGATAAPKPRDRVSLLQQTMLQMLTQMLLLCHMILLRQVKLQQGAVSGAERQQRRQQQLMAALLLWPRGSSSHQTLLIKRHLSRTDQQHAHLPTGAPEELLIWE